MKNLQIIRFALLLSFFVGMSDMAIRAEVNYLTTEEFKQLFFDFTTSQQWQYNGEKPCVIDFYTTWCGPCKRLAPIMEELSEEYCDMVVFYKIDTEKERLLAYTFGISSIPQILFVPVGERPQLARGLLPKETLKQAIEEILLHNKNLD